MDASQFEIATVDELRNPRHRIRTMREHDDINAMLSRMHDLPSQQPKPFSRPRTSAAEFEGRKPILPPSFDTFAGVDEEDAAAAAAPSTPVVAEDVLEDPDKDMVAFSDADSEGEVDSPAKPVQDWKIPSKSKFSDWFRELPPKEKMKLFSAVDPPYHPKRKPTDDDITSDYFRQLRNWTKAMKERLYPPEPKVPLTTRQLHIEAIKAKAKNRKLKE
jgi:hypothetical protein